MANQRLDNLVGLQVNKSEFEVLGASHHQVVARHDCVDLRLHNMGSFLAVT